MAPSLTMGGSRPEHGLHRTLFGHLFAERSGYGDDFAKHHTRFDHANADMHFACGCEKTPRHFGMNQPPKVRPQRAASSDRVYEKDAPSQGINVVLGVRGQDSMF